MSIIKKCWARGVEPYLFFGKPEVVRIDREPLSEGDRHFLKINREQIIKEISEHREGARISGEEFYGPGLMADAAERAKRRNNHE